MTPDAVDTLQPTMPWTRYDPRHCGRDMTRKAVDTMRRREHDTTGDAVDTIQPATPWTRYWALRALMQPLSVLTHH